MHLYNIKYMILTICFLDISNMYNYFIEICKYLLSLFFEICFM